MQDQSGAGPESRTASGSGTESGTGSGTGTDSLKSAATDLLAALTRLLQSGASAIESMAGELARGSGTVVDKSFDLTDFTAVDIGSAFRGEVTRGPQYGVVVTTDDNVMAHINVTVVDATLRVRVDGLHVLPTKLRVAVTMPAITGLTVGGASTVSLEGFDRAPTFNASLGGASHLSGAVSADTLAVNASGASRAELRGAANTLALVASGASHVTLSDLAVATADIKLSGASHASITATQSIELIASGASQLAYGGGATLLSSQVSGGSGVRQR